MFSAIPGELMFPDISGGGGGGAVSPGLLMFPAEVTPGLLMCPADAVMASAKLSNVAARVDFSLFISVS